MDIRKLKTILDLFENSSLTEIEFCEGEERIRLSKAQPAGTQPAALPLPNNPFPTAAPTAAPIAAPIAVTITEEEFAGDVVVKSPMVGTFYRSSSPDKNPFVDVGTPVKKGDTLCIVEAMKLMNEIPSPVSGVVRQVVAENGEAVGFGALLFVITE
ncbi:MAG: acetyl-CoA carboxylase biotin carboxyl carrier protein [Proteobacteria bacterium]|nr:acetyl-CoA carboxylase biotin carboxyl carrier protein [Pseudomonadota bacterium]